MEWQRVKDGGWRRVKGGGWRGVVVEGGGWRSEGWRGGGGDGGGGYVERCRYMLYKRCKESEIHMCIYRLHMQSGVRCEGVRGSHECIGVTFCASSRT